jgi:hypothetical protein
VGRKKLDTLVGQKQVDVFVPRDEARRIAAPLVLPLGLRGARGGLRKIGIGRVNEERYNAYRWKKLVQ